MAYFDTILPLSEWRESYSPFLVDSIKWAQGFDASVIASDKTKFFGMYFLAGLQNPSIYMEAFLLNNCGFWDPFVGVNENVAAYNYTNWPGVEAPDQIDLISILTGFSLRPILIPMLFPSSGLLVWILLFTSFVASLPRRGGLCGLYDAPLLLLWGTLVIASPIAYSFRYICVLLFILPVLLVLPFVITRERTSKLMDLRTSDAN